MKKLAEIFVEIGAKLNPLKTGLAKAKDMVSGFSSSVTGKLTGLFAGVSVGALGLKMIGLASDAEEMNSKLQAVWKDQADGIAKWSDAYANHVGRSKNEVRKMTTDMGDLFGPLGFSADHTEKLSKAVVALGIDLGSFNNMEDSEAIERLNAGLLGSHEVLKKFGVVVNETTLKQELMRMGFEDGSKGVTEQAKVLARWNIVMASTGNAQGDAARTSEGFANSSKALWGELADLGASLGKQLLPFASEIVAIFRQAIGTSDGLGKSFSGLGSMLSWLADGIKAVVFVLVNWDQYSKLIGIKMAELFTHSIEHAEHFAGFLGKILDWMLNNWTGVFKDMASFAKTVFENLTGNFVSLFSKIWDWVKSGFKGDLDLDWTPLAEGFKRTTEKFPEYGKPALSDFSDQYAEVDREIQKRMDALTNKTKTKTAPDLANVLKDATALDAGGYKIEVDKKEEKEKKEDKKAESKSGFVDLASAWSSLQTATLSNEARIAEKQLKVQEEQKKILKSMEVSLAMMGTPITLSE